MLIAIANIIKKGKATIVSSCSVPDCNNQVILCHDGVITYANRLLQKYKKSGCQEANLNLELSRNVFCPLNYIRIFDLITKVSKN